MIPRFFAWLRLLAAVACAFIAVELFVAAAHGDTVWERLCWPVAGYLWLRTAASTLPRLPRFRAVGRTLWTRRRTVGLDGETYRTGRWG